MHFEETPLPGAYIIAPTRQEDLRGCFARLFCVETFRAQGLASVANQISISVNRRAGTLRGMHFQAPPHTEVKLVRCPRGAVYDVIVDLRSSSPTHGRWFATELSAANGKSVYVPRGFAHGFQTLTDDTEIIYQMDTAYVAEAARGVRWNDLGFRIAWPDTPERIMCERDRDYPDYRAAEQGFE
ncbi:MAG: dTDP-4-dehydrorhamnose 3,5-epimerase family protein [Planctomycetes bacterium]|nr:dTDP-4-dehydrorhamnose 3,5-epimerase family protein [Planctomycetota bacterium]